MGWLFGDKDAVEEHRAARRDRSEYTTDAEDDEYLRRNQRVIDAEQHVPWWRR